MAVPARVPPFPPFRGGTFHSFANLTLRKYAKLLGLSNNFTILDDADAEDTVNLIRTQLGFHKQEKRFSQKKGDYAPIAATINGFRKKPYSLKAQANKAHVKMIDGGILRIEMDGLCQILDGVVIPPFQQIDNAAVIVCRNVVGINFQLNDIYLQLPRLAA
jgi:hypothetical protein